MNRTRAVICDIDGVLVNGPWFDDIEDFYRNMSSWTPIDWSVSVVQGLWDAGYQIIFVTARDEKVRIKTTQQLQDMFNFNIKLYMRPTGDLRASCVIKEEVLLELMDKYEITLAIDDETPNCEMYKRHNIPVMQVYSQWSDHQ